MDVWVGPVADVDVSEGRAVECVPKSLLSQLRQVDKAELRLKSMWRRGAQIPWH
jgi:hypothetical protein